MQCKSTCGQNTPPGSCFFRSCNHVPCYRPQIWEDSRHGKNKHMPYVRNSTHKPINSRKSSTATHTTNIPGHTMTLSPQFLALCALIFIFNLKTPEMISYREQLRRSHFNPKYWLWAGDCSKVHLLWFLFFLYLKTSKVVYEFKVS